MRTAAVSVRVHMHATAAPQPAQRVGTENDQHDGDAELERHGDAIADLDVQDDHRHAGDEQRKGMANAPQRADRRRAPYAAVLADDGRYGRHVLSTARCWRTMVDTAAT